LADQRDQPVESVLLVPLLRADPPRVDDQHALFGHPLAGQADQALTDVVG